MKFWGRPRPFLKIGTHVSYFKLGRTIMGNEILTGEQFHGEIVRKDLLYYYVLPNDDKRNGPQRPPKRGGDCYRMFRWRSCQIYCP